jgi:PHD-finger
VLVTVPGKRPFDHGLFRGWWGRLADAFFSSNDSVDCAVCQNTYHMNCVKPPLLKKPSRGFAWSCAACSRAQERKLEARNTPNVADPNGDPEEEEVYDDEDDDLHAADTGRTSPDDEQGSHPVGTPEQVYQASLWPYRYLGMHCKLEDALDIDDRIYPRASSRIGPRHQANVLPWPGRAVEYVKPLVEIKKNGKNQPKLSKEAQAAVDEEKAKREKRPKWVQDEPPGYVRRGEDYDEDDPRNTAVLLWKPVKTNEVTEDQLDDYMKKAKAMAPELGLPERSTNLQDQAIETLFMCGYSPERALNVLRDSDRVVFKEPNLSPAEQKKFEEGVAKYGSELHSVKKHVRTVPHGMIVRYYYTWKKTERGKQIWDNFPGRKGKKEAKKAEAAVSKLQDDVADDHDDSSFDAEKAVEKKRAFICKFCSTKSSRQWRRAPNASVALVTENGTKASNKDKGAQYIQALCRRCAELWRRYAIQWEDIDEVAKKVAQAGGRAWKRRQDEELLKELIAAKEMALPDSAASPANTSGSAGNGHQTGEPPRKKLKGAHEKDDQNGSDAGSVSGANVVKKKEKVIEKNATAPAPDIPKPRTLPCAICNEMEPMGEHLSCRECRLTVHRNCYGVSDHRNPGKWVCDMCANDKNPQVSIVSV